MWDFTVEHIIDDFFSLQVHVVFDFILQVVTLPEAKLLLKEDDDLTIAVYDYWLNKRLRLVRKLNHLVCTLNIVLGVFLIHTSLKNIKFLSDLYLELKS